MPDSADARAVGRPGGSIRRLAAVNGVLALALAGLTLAQSDRDAREQPRDDEPVRARGEYTMVSAPTPAAGSDAILILDGVNQELAITTWDRTRQTMNIIGYRDLTADSRAQPGR